MKKQKSRIPERGEGSPQGDLSHGSRIQSVFAYPTESFYALGANATNAQAIAQLFRLKHREKNKPVALICSSLAQVKKYFFLNKTEFRLAKRYWPGSVTILLKPRPMLAADALLGTPSPRAKRAGAPPQMRGRGVRIGDQHRLVLVGVRVPAHANARRLALAAGVPLTATSANISGRPPTKSAAAVKRNFPGILVMPGRCGRQSLPSTVVQVQKNKLIVLRSGAVPCQID